jgi:putative membrane protein
MENDTHILKAEFDPKVRTYWLVSGMIICVVTVVGIPLLLLWVPLGLILTGHYLKRMECVLTPKALKVKKGIMVRVEKTIPLDKITDMAVVQGPVMRHFNINKLTVETAGQSGPGALVVLIGIIDSKSFREAVLAQKDKMSDQSGSQHSTPESSPDLSGSTTLEEVRDSLLRIESLLSDTKVANDDPEMQ